MRRHVAVIGAVAAGVGTWLLIGGLMAGVGAAASSAQATSSCTGTLTVTCTYSGAADSATAPPNADEVTIDASGAQGGGATSSQGPGVATAPT